MIGFYVALLLWSEISRDCRHGAQWGRADGEKWATEKCVYF